MCFQSVSLRRDQNGSEQETLWAGSLDISQEMPQGPGYRARLFSLGCFPHRPRWGQATPGTSLPGPHRRADLPAAQLGCSWSWGLPTLNLPPGEVWQGPHGVSAPAALSLPQAVPGHRVRQWRGPHVPHAETEEASRGARQVGAVLVGGQARAGQRGPPWRPGVSWKGGGVWGDMAKRAPLSPAVRLRGPTICGSPQLQSLRNGPSGLSLQSRMARRPEKWVLPGRVCARWRCARFCLSLLPELGWGCHASRLQTPLSGIMPLAVLITWLQSRALALGKE